MTKSVTLWVLVAVCVASLNTLPAARRKFTYSRIRLSRSLSVDVHLSLRFGCREGVQVGDLDGLLAFREWRYELKTHSIIDDFCRDPDPAAKRYQYHNLIRISYSHVVGTSSVEVLIWDDH